jgi:P4 family phage/plasmid primase-like protien
MSTPYQLAAREYFAVGWSPIPLPTREKHPVPDQPAHFTGAVGLYVDQAQLDAWLAPKARVRAGNLSFAAGNIALRLPKTVIGIDVDAYGSKKGAETLEKAEEAWGALPATYVITSRDDGISGIRLYRIPEGLAWPGELPQGKGVELLRWDHRYAMVAPSLHDETGAEYRWHKEQDGDEVRSLTISDEFPAPEDLPALPAEWVAGLTSGRKWTATEVNEDMDASELQAWLAARVDPDDICAFMSRTVAKYTREVRQASDDGGAHDAARDGAWAILGDAGSGHGGVIAALTSLRNVFLKAVEGRRGNERIAKTEWARIVTRGAAKVSAEGDPATEDPCLSLKAASKSNGGSKDINWRMDDIGNAERLIRVMADNARYIEGYNSWYIWDGATWNADRTRQVERWAVKTVNNMDQELEFLKGDAKPALLSAFKKHIKASGGAGRLAAMVTVARGRKGITLNGAEFDGNPRLLGCSNGVLELAERDIRFRPVTREDYLTLNTRVEYDKKASSTLWDSFLKRVQPDQEVREWLQMLVGYSLLGVNMQRLLVVAAGPTSTGKTTFAEAFAAALGDYAGPMPASVLRDNADDKPRPDLLDALPKRVVIAEELGTAQHLHPDQIKRLTGGSTVAARGMRANTYVYRVPAFTPWLVTNSAPTVSGADQALWRRLLVVPFTVQIPLAEEKPQIRQLLTSEARAAVLRWAVDGYLAWVELVTRGGTLLDMPLSVVEANMQFRSDMSDLDGFIAEACVLGAEESCAPRELYDAYQHWCERGNVSVRDQLSERRFGMEITAKGYHKKSIRTEEGPRSVRCGIALNPQWKRLV